MYMTGRGPKEIHKLLQTQKNTWAWNFTHQKNTWHQNFLHKITSMLIYSIKQTLLMHAFVTVNELIKLVSPLMPLHPPLWSTFTHRSSLCEPPKVCSFFVDLKKYIIDLLTTKKKYRGWKFSSKKIHQAPPPVMYTASKPSPHPGLKVELTVKLFV